MALAQHSGGGGVSSKPKINKATTTAAPSSGVNNPSTWAGMVETPTPSAAKPAATKPAVKPTFGQRVSNAINTIANAFKPNTTSVGKTSGVNNPSTWAGLVDTPTAPASKTTTTPVIKPASSSSSARVAKPPKVGETITPSYTFLTIGDNAASGSEYNQQFNKNLTDYNTRIDNTFFSTGGQQDVDINDPVYLRTLKSDGEAFIAELERNPNKYDEEFIRNSIGAITRNNRRITERLNLLQLGDTQDPEVQKEAAEVIRKYTSPSFRGSDGKLSKYDEANLIWAVNMIGDKAFASNNEQFSQVNGADQHLWWEKQVGNGAGLNKEYSGLLEDAVKVLQRDYGYTEDDPLIQYYNAMIADSKVLSDLYDKQAGGLQGLSEDEQKKYIATYTAQQGVDRFNEDYWRSEIDRLREVADQQRAIALDESNSGKLDPTAAKEANAAANQAEALIDYYEQLISGVHDYEEMERLYNSSESTGESANVGSYLQKLNGIISDGKTELETLRSELKTLKQEERSAAVQNDYDGMTQKQEEIKAKEAEIAQVQQTMADAQGEIDHQERIMGLREMQVDFAREGKELTPASVAIMQDELAKYTAQIKAENRTLAGTARDVWDITKAGAKMPVAGVLQFYTQGLKGLDFITTKIANYITGEDTSQGVMAESLSDVLQRMEDRLVEIQSDSSEETARGLEGRGFIGKLLGSSIQSGEGMAFDKAYGAALNAATGGVLGKHAGLVSMAQRVFGQSVSEAKAQEKATGEKAEHLYLNAIIDAAIEVGSEMLGGDAFSGTYGEGLIDTMRKGVSKAATSGKLKNILLPMGEEALEEDVAFIAHRLVEFIMGKRDLSELVKMTEDDWEEFAISNLSAALLAGGDSAADAIAKTSYGYTLQANRDEILQKALETPENTPARQLAEKYKDDISRISDYDLYRLDAETKSQGLQDDIKSTKNAVLSRLAALGEPAGQTTDILGTKEDASSLDKLADVIVLKTLGEDLTESNQKILDNSKYGQRVVNELNPENIRKGQTASDWTMDIESKVLHPEVYTHQREERTIANLVRGLGIKLSDKNISVLTEAYRSGKVKDFNAYVSGLQQAILAANAGRHLEEVVARNERVKNLTPHQRNVIWKIATEATDSEYRFNKNEPMTLNGVTGKLTKLTTRAGSMTAQLTDETTGEVHNVQLSKEDWDGLLNTNPIIRTIYNEFNGLTGDIINAYDSDSDVPLSVYLENLRALKQAAKDSGVTWSTFVNSEAGQRIAANVPQNIQRRVWNQARSTTEAKQARADARAVSKSEAPSTNYIRSKGTVTSEAQRFTINGKEYDLPAYDLSKAKKGSKDYRVGKLVKGIAQVTGINVVLYENTSELGINGAYDKKTKTLFLDMNRIGDNGEILLTKTISHELTHFIQDESPEDYAALKLFITNKLMNKKGGRTYEQILQEKMDREGIGAEEASDEIVADGCEMMLKNSKAFKELAEENLTLAEKLRNHLVGLFDKLNKFYKGVDTDYEETRYLAQYSDQIQKMWDRGIKNASINLDANRKNAALREFENQPERVAARNAVNAFARNETRQMDRSEKAKGKSARFGKSADEIKGQTTIDKNADAEKRKATEEAKKAAEKEARNLREIPEQEDMFGEMDSAMQMSFTPYTSKEINNWKNSKNIIIYQSSNQLLDFIKDAKAGKLGAKKIYFGKVSAELAARVKATTGVEIEGYNCTLGAYEVSKIFAKHGNETKESDRGQRALTENDLLEIPVIISEAEEIKLSGTWNGKPVIDFKKINGGKITVSAYVSDKHIDLRVQTMYASKKYKSLATPIGEQAPINTPEASSGTALNKIISQSETKSNTRDNAAKAFRASPTREHADTRVGTRNDSGATVSAKNTIAKTNKTEYNTNTTTTKGDNINDRTGENLVSNGRTGQNSASLHETHDRSTKGGRSDGRRNIGLIGRILERAITTKDHGYVQLNDVTEDPDSYIEALAKAKNDNRYGFSVDLQTKESLRDNGAIIFLSDDGGAGVAVEKNGNIVGVFKDPEINHTRNAVISLITQAVANGGTRLDCFVDRKGPRSLGVKYSELGFVPVARMNFDKSIWQEDHPGEIWDDSLMKDPYVVWYKAAELDPIKMLDEHYIWNGIALDQYVPIIENYDEAVAMADRLCAEDFIRDSDGETYTRSGFAEMARNISEEGAELTDEQIEAEFNKLLESVKTEGVFKKSDLKFSLVSPSAELAQQAAYDTGNDVRFSIHSDKDIQSIDTSAVQELSNINRQINEILKSDEYKTLTERITSGITGDELDRAIAELKDFGVRTGLDELTAKREEANEKVRAIREAERERYEQFRSDIESFTEEETNEAASNAEKMFGTTSRRTLAGFLDTNGKMLDFSEGQGYRVQDHREIAGALNLPDYAGYSDGLIAFMNMGNIRLQTYGIDISHKPGADQNLPLRRIIDDTLRKEGVFVLDISDTKGYNVTSVEYPEGISSSRILNDINEYFDNGAIPNYNDPNNPGRTQFSLIRRFDNEQLFLDAYNNRLDEEFEGYVLSPAQERMVVPKIENDAQADYYNNLPRYVEEIAGGMIPFVPGDAIPDYDRSLIKYSSEWYKKNGLPIPVKSTPYAIYEPALVDDGSVVERDELPFSISTPTSEQYYTESANYRNAQITQRNMESARNAQLGKYAPSTVAQPENPAPTPTDVSTPADVATPAPTGARTDAHVGETQVPGRQKQSKFASNTLEGMNIWDEIGGRENTMDRNGEFLYNEVTERESMEAARQRLEADWGYWERDLMGEYTSPTADREWTGKDLDTAMAIFRQKRIDAKRNQDQSLTPKERYADVDAWLQRIREKATGVGQLMQAFAKYSRTPEGALIQAGRDLASNNKLTKDQRNEILNKMIDFAMTLDALREAGDTGDNSSLIELIKQQAEMRGTPVSQRIENGLRKEQYQYLYDVALTQLAQIAADYRPNSVGKKLSTYQTIAHLLNLRTGTRNVVANMAFRTVDRIANMIAAPMDALVGKITGNRTVGWKQLGRLSSEVRETEHERGRRASIEASLDVDPYNGKDKYGTSRRTWKMKDGPGARVMSTLEKWMAYELNVTDEISKGIILGEVMESLSPFIENNLLSEDEAVAMAKQEMLYRTFQDDNWANGLLGAIKNALNVIGTGSTNGKMIGSLPVHDFGLGDIVTKYVQVPGSLIMRMIEYSPVGTIKAVADMANIFTAYNQLSRSNTLEDAKQAVADLRQQLAEAKAAGADTTELKAQLKEATSNYKDVKSRTGDIRAKAFLKDQGQYTKTKVAINNEQARMNALQAQRRAMLQLGRSLTGSGLIALFAALAKAGLLRRDDDDEDKDIRALNTSAGLSGTQLNLSALMRAASGETNWSEWLDGDKLMDIGFLEPLNGLMTIGAIVAKNNDNLISRDTMNDTLAGLMENIAELPVMQTLGTIQSSIQNLQYDAESENATQSIAKDVMSVAIDVARSSASGFIPAPVRQAAQATDEYARDMYQGDTGAEKFVDSLKSSIPGLRQTLPQKLDNFGNPRTTENDPFARAMNAFINPGNLRTYRSADLTNELNRLYDATGKSGILPKRYAPYSINEGPGYQLTADEKRVYQITRGQTADNLLRDLFSSQAYQTATDEQRAEWAKDVVSYADYVAKQEFLNNRNYLDEKGEGYSSRAKEEMKEALAKGVPLDTYLKYVDAIDRRYTVATYDYEARNETLEAEYRAGNINDEQFIQLYDYTTNSSDTTPEKLTAASEAGIAPPDYLIYKAEINNNPDFNRTKANYGKNYDTANKKAVSAYIWSVAKTDEQAKILWLLRYKESTLNKLYQYKPKS